MAIRFASAPEGGSGPSVPGVRLDHVLVGAADLAAGRDEIERRTGVRPAAGGSHPQWGSHNALLALGPACYLELVAPRPGAPAAGPFAALRELARPTPVGWALAVDDLQAARRNLRARGHELTEIAPGARQRPDGRRLEWRTMRFAARPMVGAWPFFIEWGDTSLHPAADAPAGCRLRGLSVATPQAAELTALCDALGLAVEVRKSAETRLAFELDTPAGQVTLGR